MGQDGDRTVSRHLRRGAVKCAARLREALHAGHGLQYVGAYAAHACARLLLPKLHCPVSEAVKRPGARLEFDPGSA
jgi:hypothetical protein